MVTSVKYIYILRLVIENQFSTTVLLLTQKKEINLFSPRRATTTVISNSSPEGAGR